MLLSGKLRRRLDSIAKGLNSSVVESSTIFEKLDDKERIFFMANLVHQLNVEEQIKKASEK